MGNPAPLCSPMTHLSLTGSTEHILQPMREVGICSASLPGGPVALNTVSMLCGPPRGSCCIKHSFVCSVDTHIKLQATDSCYKHPLLQNTL